MYIDQMGLMYVSTAVLQFKTKNNQTKDSVMVR